MTKTEVVEGAALEWDGNLIDGLDELTVDGVRYVRERTCHVEYALGTEVGDFWLTTTDLSCGHRVFEESTEIAFCSRCGARVERE